MEWFGRLRGLLVGLASLDGHALFSVSLRSSHVVPHCWNFLPRTAIAVLRHYYTTTPRHLYYQHHPLILPPPTDSTFPATDITYHR